MDHQNVFGISEMQIGNTLYIVETKPSERATETLEQLLVRFIGGRIAEDLKRVKIPEKA